MIRLYQRETSAALIAASAIYLVLLQSMGPSTDSRFGSTLHWVGAMAWSGICIGGILFLLTCRMDPKPKLLTIIVTCLVPLGLLANWLELRYGEVDLLEGRVPVARVPYQKYGGYASYYSFRADPDVFGKALRAEMERRDAISFYHGQMIYQKKFYDVYPGKWANGKLVREAGWVTVQVSE